MKVEVIENNLYEFIDSRIQKAMDNILILEDPSKDEINTYLRLKQWYNSMPYNVENYLKTITKEEEQKEENGE